MYSPNNKLARDEALRRVSKSDILHSSGLVNNNTVTGTSSSQTYKQRQEMIRQHIGNYSKSQLGTARNPALRSIATEQKPGTRFDAHIKRRTK